MADNKSIVDRAVGWLRGDDIAERAQLKAAGLFPFDATYRGNQYNWTAPTPNGDSVYYWGNIDFAVEAGDLIDNSAVMACFLWAMRTFPEAPLRVMKRQRNAKPVEVENHPLTMLWRRPNPHYSGRLLQQPTLISFLWNGNGPIRKVRNGQKQVIQMYYEPHWTIRPVRASAEDFISYYQVYRDFKWVDIPIEDVIMLRHGLDPENPMKGLSPMASALREVFTDNAAGRYASAVMNKLGVLGAIVTPKDPEIGIEHPERLKAQLQAISTGDNRGDYGVFSEALDFNYPPNDPAKMDTRGNRKITEERISGLLGIPAIVAGLGAGLDRSTFANMAEAREMAYESMIIPTQSLWADELNTQLLPELGDPDTEYVDWDYSKVRVLQEDLNKKATMLSTLYTSGVIKRSEARGEMDYKNDPADEVYRISPLLEVALLNQGRVAPSVLDAVDTDGELLPEAPEAPTDAQELSKAHTNGNGHGTPEEYHAVRYMYEGKAKKPTVDSVTDAILQGVKAEVLRVYEEAESKVGG